MREAVESGLIPPGTYFVGDPCYAIPDDEWMPYLEHGGDNYKIEGMVITLKRDRLVASVNTAFGDGVYEGSDGNNYGVDAGLLGVVSILPGDNIEELQRLGTTRIFEEPFTVSYDTHGMVHIGYISIDTDPEEGDDE